MGVNTNITVSDCSTAGEADIERVEVFVEQTEASRNGQHLWQIPRQKVVKPASPGESPSRTDLLHMIQQAAEKATDARSSQHGWLERQMEGIDDSDAGSKSD